MAINPREYFLDTSMALPFENKLNFLTYSVKPQVDMTLQHILCQNIVDLVELKKISWQGLECPLMRAQIWRLILGYESPDKQNRSEELQSKRLEYLEMLKSHKLAMRKGKSKKILNSFSKYELFQHKTVETSLTNIITLVSECDIIPKNVAPVMVVPFFIVFLSEFYPVDLENLQVHDEGPQKFYMSIVEADAYWCATIFLRLFSLKRHTKLYEKIIWALERFDSVVFLHLNIEKLSMSFITRWIKYLFLKDFPLHVCLRIFDEIISNKTSKVSIDKCTDSIQNNFIVCVVCALLSFFRNQILMSNGEQLKVIMSKLPTDTWSEIEILIIISQAYLYQSILD